MSVQIHQTAVVEGGVELDADVEIGPYAVIYDGVKLAAETTVGAHAVITGQTHIGPNCTIAPHAVIGTPPQDKKYAGERTELHIGADNIIREFATINPGTAAGGGQTIIGDRNLLMAYVHVAHDCRIANDTVLANGAQLAGHAELQDHVTIGGMSGVHQFVRVGRCAMVGGGSMVTQDVPPYCVAAGNRAKLSGINSIGLRRNGFDKDALARLRACFRTLFRQGMPLPQALAQASEYSDDPHIAAMLAFIRESERGVMRADRHA